MTAVLFVIWCAAATSAKGPAAGDAPSSALKVGSYNVRCSPADAGTPNAWPERKDDLLALLRRLDLDAGGLQEVCPDQLKFFKDGMPDGSASARMRYSATGVRTDSSAS